MKTTGQRLVDYLVDKGMSESQAKAVLDIAKPEIERYCRITWDRPAPPAMYAAMILVINPIAVKWIDENLPKAWFRGMFL